MTDSNKYINGPLNVARLEGKVNGITKILYLFMDMHINPNMQTQCEGIHSLDIDKYIIKQFDNFQKTDKILDLFVEIRHDQYKYKSDYKGMYIEQILKLFKNQYSFNKNKMSHAKDYKNVRLHNMDFRDYFPLKITNHIYALMDVTNDVQSSVSIGYEDVGQMIVIINAIIISTKEVLSVIKSPKKTNIHTKIETNEKGILVKDISDEDRMKILNNLIYKMKNVYNNKHIQKIFLNEIDSNFIPRYEYFINYMENALKTLNKKRIFLLDNTGTRFDTDDGSFYNIPSDIVRDIILTVANISSDIFSMELRLHSNLIDYYMLRRFLDKNYITNSVSYTGINHSIHMLRFLLKFFDFKLTHISKNSYNDVKTLSDKIINTKYASHAQRFVYPPYKKQCSDLTHFPDNFE